ncbi:hypothetical protein GGF43_004648 [Coemansia sp. RSA 2618]|nr:hypothetical protein GGF43_004648 [Coemansia sp. RSA 2618]
MYTVFIFNGYEKYLASWTCGPSTTVANIKKYASLWMKVSPSELSLYAFDISDRPLSDETKFDEKEMPVNVASKYLMVYAAVPFKLDDHPIRQNARRGVGTSICFYDAYEPSLRA